MEETKWGDSLSLNLHAYAVVLNRIYFQGMEEEIQQEKLRSLCPAVPQDSITRVQNLLFCIQEDCNGYWEWVSSILPDVSSIKPGVISQASVYESVKCLLSYYALHSYGFTSDRLSRYHSLLHYVLYLHYHDVVHAT